MVTAPQLVAGQYKYTDGTNSVLGLSVANKALKEWYLPGVHDALNSATILLQYLGRNTEDVAGKYAKTLIRMGRNQARQPVAEGARLPFGGRQNTEVATYYLRDHYGSILLTGQSINASRNDRGSFINLLDMEVKGLAMDLGVQVNQILFGDGTGRLARIAGVAGKVYTVDQPGGFSNPGNGTMYLEVGMKLAASVGGSLTAMRDSVVRTIINVNRAAQTFETDVAFAGPAAVGDYIYLSSALGNNPTVASGDGLYAQSTRTTPFGLQAVVNDTNPLAVPYNSSGTGYGDITVTNNDWWQARVLDNGGVAVPFNQDMLQQLQDAIEKDAGGTVKLWLTTHNIRRYYVQSLVANKRYVNTMQLDGGYRAVEFNEIPMVPDRDCTPGRVYGLDPSLLSIYMGQEWDWIPANDAGAVLSRLEGYHAYGATMWKAWELGTAYRNKQGVVKDIQDS